MRHGEKRIATYVYTPHMLIMLTIQYSKNGNIAVMYHRGWDAEIAIFPTAPEVDSPPYNFKKITVYQFESWNIIVS